MLQINNTSGFQQKPEAPFKNPKGVQYQVEKDGRQLEVVKLINKVVFSGKKW